MFGAEPFPEVSTGTDLVTSSSNAMMTTNGPGTLSRMSPMESVQELFVSMANSLQVIVENTTQTNELLKGTDAEQRDKNIGDSDTDGDKDKPKDKGLSALDKLKGIFSKLNPFSDGGPGPIGTAVIAGLGLLGLNMFGDEAQKGIEYLLDALKNGKIGTMLSDFGDSIKEQFNRLKKTLGSIITEITDYIDKFDLNNDGLDPDELNLLLEDLKTRAVDVISGFFSDVFNTLKFSILTTLFLGTAVKSLLGNAAIKNIFSSVPKGFIGPRAPVPGIGLAGGLGIAALIGYGIIATYKNAANAITKSMEDGDSGMGSFIANFLGGDGEGSFFNAMKQGLLVAGTGALGGAALGLKFMTIGAAGGPAGMLAGALIGFAVGGIIGVIGGSVGSDAIKGMMDTVGTAITEMMDSIETFMMDAFESVRKLFTGRLTSRETDPVRLNEELAKAKQELTELELDPTGVNIGKIKRKKEEIEDIKTLLSLLTPEMIAQAKQDKANDMTRNADAGIDTQRGYLADAQRRIDKFSAIDNRTTLQDGFLETARNDYADAENLIQKFQLKKKKILTDLNIDYEIPPAKNAIKEATDNINGMGRSNAPGGNIIANNNNITDNSTKVVANAPGGNNFNPYPSDVERMLNRLNGMGVA